VNAALTGQPIFHALFRAEISEYLEYSFAEDAERYGTMISGAGSSFMERVCGFGRATILHGPCLRSLDGLSKALVPASYFFKVDWLGAGVEQLTLYCRFDGTLQPEALRRALAQSQPFAWNTAEPHALARVLGEASPVIIALRVHASGQARMASYFRIRRPREEFLEGELPPLLDLLSLRCSMAAEIRTTLASLIGFWFPPMIGIDSPEPGGSATLKIDVAGVCLSEAVAFLKSLGAGADRVSRLGRVGRGLGLEVLNYVGSKFTASGQSAWKLYMPVHSRRSVLTPGPKLRILEAHQPPMPMQMW
jgi:hypothetical protein